MFDVISIGDSCQDIFLYIHEDDARVFCEINKDACEIRLNYADKIPVQQKFEAVGGNAANVAVSAARLGLNTALYTHVGDDKAGKHVLAEIADAGVMSDYFMKDSHDETNYNTVISVAGERTILAYHRPRHYALPHLAAAKWIYFTSMKDGFEKTIPAVLAYCKKHNAKLCFQPGTYQLKQRGGGIESLLKATDLFFVNKEEAIRYLNVDPGTTIAGLLKGIHNLGVKIAIITDGAHGAYGSDSTGSYFMPTLEGVERKESTGAGDAFASATMSALCLHQPLPEAMRWGLMQASSVIQKVGAQAGLMNRSEIIAYLQKYAAVTAQPLIQE